MKMNNCNRRNEYFLSCSVNVFLTMLLGFGLTACHVKLPAKFYRKPLTEKDYVENRKEDYTLHLNNIPEGSQVFVQTNAGGMAPYTKFPTSDTLIALRKQVSRPYFYVVSGKDSTVLANRRVDFGKVVNFRDIGGIITRDGKTVRWGKIFRSDNLSRLKNKEFDKFNNLNISTVYDLRTSHEIKGKEDQLPDQVKYFHTPMVKDNEGQIAQLRAKVIAGEISEEQAVAQTIGFYKDAVTVNMAAYRDVVHQILDADKPVLYHCSAGKDRTGMVSAFILSVLNVDRQTIVDEYLMSNYYRRGKTEKMLGKAKLARVIKPRMDLQAIEVFMNVDESYLNAVFEIVDKQYGGTDLFVRNQLGIDDAARKRIIAKFTY
ncbi:hypothetical protein DYBT9275_02362 [Dyadobacter sp. CECT 9275]|uniref:Tyrosine specific protein phosphatases domain-containing protein n=1 Tax=Dyadobacter helix TaxID=2822344 RepID=A0A916JBG8_9BACT|nr:tyrosine-protein phosphatase [Dyadobacter sp. CECT 9275]CAG4999993.1 hypothetical protein DYBT9275_02362 [Dyadobacter sp. CECT 9275]